MKIDQKLLLVAMFFCAIELHASPRTVEELPDLNTGLGWYPKTDVVTDLTFRGADEDEPPHQLKMEFPGKKMKKAEGIDIFFVYIYFFMPEAYQKIQTWKDWHADAATAARLPLVLKKRLPKECKMLSSDRLKAGCWMNKLVAGKRIEITIGKFIVEGGKNIYSDEELKTKFDE